MLEVWKPVINYPDYEVSDLGRVKSFARGEARILQAGKSSNGYFTVSLGSNNSICVHVLVAEAFIGPRPDGMDVMHIDGTRTNNCASNLCYGTRSQNNIQASLDGRRKFSPQIIKEIRESKKTGVELSKEYGMSQSQVSNIKRFRHWKFI